jgi:type I restriction enzyme S subunit
MGNKTRPERHTANTEQSGGWLYYPAFPEHWERRSLYSLAEWVNGLPFRNIQFSPTGKPVIKIAEIKGGISGQTEFTEQVFDESVHVRSGDLLFSWSGQPETSIDAFWWRGPDGWLNQHVFRVTPIEQLDRTFFYYLLRYLKPNFIGIARNKQTTGLGHVTKRDLESIQAAYPTLEEQRAIAHILGTLDDKIELNGRMNETLEAMARAIFKSWFIDFDPVRAKMEGRWQRGQSLPGLPAHLFDLWPDSFQDSPLGKIPKGWRAGKFHEMIELQGGGTPKTSVPGYWNGTIPWFSVVDAPRLSDVFVVDTEKKITEAGLESSSTKVLPTGTTVISARGTVGKLALLGRPMAMNQSCYGIRPRNGYGDNFTYFCLRDKVDELSQSTHGTVFDTITRDTFKVVDAVIPPESVTRKFDEAVRPFLGRILSNLLECKALADLRDTLLPKLISGELRVKDAERFVRRNAV